MENESYYLEILTLQLYLEIDPTIYYIRVYVLIIKQNCRLSIYILYSKWMSVSNKKMKFTS